MSRPGYSMAAVLEKFRDFDRVATQLDMLAVERLNILNVSDEVYLLLRDGKAANFDRVRPELERRLSYALPLMRRLAQAQSMVRSISPAAEPRMAVAAA